VVASVPARPSAVNLRLLLSDEGLSYAEIARRLELPVGSIGPMRGRGLEMLGRSFGAADAA
jgi:DNA-directed RNA polymerase specialized sigma24 family protein